MKKIVLTAALAMFAVCAQAQSAQPATAPQKQDGKAKSTETKKADPNSPESRSAAKDKHPETSPVTPASPATPPNPPTPPVAPAPAAQPDRSTDAPKTAEPKKADRPH